MPGEGYVIVKCKIITKCGKTYRAAKKLLIVPVVECELVFEEYVIGNHTKCIDLVGDSVCGEVDIGNPFYGEPDYVCGGACIDACPRYEVVVGEMEGTYISKYGKHTICAPVNLYVGDRTAEKIKIQIGAATEDLELPPEDIFFQQRQVFRGRRNRYSQNINSAKLQNPRRRTKDNR